MKPPLLQWPQLPEEEQVVLPFPLQLPGHSPSRQHVLPRANGCVEADALVVGPARSFLLWKQQSPIHPSSFLRHYTTSLSRQLHIVDDEDSFVMASTMAAVAAAKTWSVINNHWKWFFAEVRTAFFNRKLWMSLPRKVMIFALDGFPKFSMRIFQKSNTLYM